MNETVKHTALTTMPEQFWFEQEHEVRTVIDEVGGIWFCAKDVFAALDISWIGISSLKNYPKDWFMVMSFITIKGERELFFVNEPAVYRLIFRSDKPRAEAFANWVCGEVLPAIRKQGYYGQLEVDVPQQIKLTSQLITLVGKVKATNDLFEYEILIKRIRAICGLLQEPMPDVAHIGQDRGQHNLDI